MAATVSYVELLGKGLGHLVADQVGEPREDWEAQRLLGFAREGFDRWLPLAKMCTSDLWRIGQALAFAKAKTPWGKWEASLRAERIPPDRAREAIAVFNHYPTEDLARKDPITKAKI